MNITNVFTDDWLQKLHKKYDRLKPHQRPDLYYIATDKQYQALRQEIETYVATLPSARKLISDLRSPIHFQHTYHELIVGNALLQRGYQPEYDKQIDTLTPDWYVPANAHIPAFLIEVVTTDVSRTRVALQRQVEDLLVRLEAVPVGVVLGITLNDLTVALNPQRVKDMVRQVRTWLSQKPSVGAQRKYIRLISKSYATIANTRMYTIKVLALCSKSTKENYDKLLLTKLVGTKAYQSQMSCR